MSEIILKDINKYYGINHILKGITFDINKDEKIGLLGKNGSGKTTIFKIITGEENFENGSLNILKNRKIELLEQIPIYPENFSSNDVLKTSFKDLNLKFDRMKKLEECMKKEINEQLIKEYGALQTEFESKDGYNIDSKIDKICNGLKINDKIRNQKFDFLSGGEKTRVNLARILLKNPDILLLDEPTNHLDIESIKWLEEYIVLYKGIVIIISHDRLFLDKTVERIIEIKDGKAEFYQGNYSYYFKEKKIRYESQLNQFNQQQKQIKHLEEAAKRLHEWGNRADNKKLHTQAFNIEKRIEKMDKVEKPNRDKKVIGNFNEKVSKSKELISINNISKAYGNKILFENVSVNLYKDERIAIIGSNGSGKTTLLRLILNEENLEKGNIKLKEGIKYVYLQQDVKFENPDYSIIETLRYSIEVNEENAKRILAKFHFFGEDNFKKIKKLSGGEKSRLKLCILMQNKCDLLILDEPTNHLDISSREWVESAIESFKGAILFISHDRYFIKKFAKRIWEIDKKIVDFNGNYDDFLSWKDKKQEKKLLEINKVEKKVTNKKKKKNTKVKSDKLKNDIEEKIEKMEIEITNINFEISKNTNDYKKLEKYLFDKEALDLELESLYSKWLELS